MVEGRLLGLDLGKLGLHELVVGGQLLGTTGGGLLGRLFLGHVCVWCVFLGVRGCCVFGVKKKKRKREKEKKEKRGKEKKIKKLVNASVFILLT